jgi:integrase
MPLYKRDDSPYWWVRIGRKTRESTGTEDRAKAEEYEELLKERLWRRNKLGDRGAVPWREAAQRWLKDSKRSRVRDREILQWLESEDGPDIGEYPVAAVADPDVIQELREHGLTQGWTHSTVDRAMRTVRSVLRKCVEWKYLETAPKVPMYGDEDSDPRFLTPEQFARLCSELPRHLEIAARFAVWTLLRKTAQAKLTWDRVNMQTKTGFIPKAHMKGMNDKKKDFIFPLSTEAIKALRECRVLHPKGERVFQYTPDGKDAKSRPIANFNTAAFRKAAERAGIVGLRWHDLRHTGASWAVQSGVTLERLMELGGWKSYRMVLIYARFAPSHAATAAETLAQMAHAVESAAQEAKLKTPEESAA